MDSDDILNAIIEDARKKDASTECLSETLNRPKERQVKGGIGTRKYIFPGTHLVSFDLDRRGKYKFSFEWEIQMYGLQRPVWILTTLFPRFPFVL